MYMYMCVCVCVCVCIPGTQPAAAAAADTAHWHPLWGQKGHSLPWHRFPCTSSAPPAAAAPAPTVPADGPSRVIPRRFVF